MLLVVDVGPRPQPDVIRRLLEVLKFSACRRLRTPEKPSSPKNNMEPRMSSLKEGVCR